MLDAVVGEKDGIGVENLEFGHDRRRNFRAYADAHAVVRYGRSVGIGAYLNRLTRRVIQMKQGPIILTATKP